MRALPLEPLGRLLRADDGVARGHGVAVLASGARPGLGSEARALVAIPLLFGTWLVAANVREYVLVDPLAWAFVAGVWLATVGASSGGWPCVLGAVGVVAKEVVLLAVVAAAVGAWSLPAPGDPLRLRVPAIAVVRY